MKTEILGRYVGIALVAITLSGISFLGGSLHSSNRYAKAEADLIEREARLVADQKNFDEILKQFEAILDKSEAATAETINTLESLK